MALSDDIQNAEDLAQVMQQLGPRKVVNDDVEVTARSATELIELMKFARQSKVSVKKAVRCIGFARQRKPNANGDC